MINRDTVAGAALLSFCALVYWFTTGFDEPPSMLSQNVPPTFFPRLVISIIVVLSIGLVVSGARKPRSASMVIKQPVFLTGAMIVIASLLVSSLGTLPTIALFAFALPLVWGERRWPLITALALLLPVSVYLIFTVALDVRFPVGKLAGGLF